VYSAVCTRWPWFISVDCGRSPSSVTVAFSPQANDTDRGRIPAGGEDIAWSVQRNPTVVNVKVSGTEPLRFHSKYLLSYAHEAVRTPFRTHYFSEHQVAPANEPGTSGSVVRNSDHQATDELRILRGDEKQLISGMVSPGLFRRVALVRTDVSEEPGASFIRVTKIGASCSLCCS
jgi:hypothetical protein